MNPIADLKADVLRTLFIYIVPGAIACLPLMCLLANVFDGAIDYADKHQSLAAVVLIVSFLSIGKLMDGLGTIWEVGVNDEKLAKKKEFPNFKQDWSRYIRSAFVHEPVAIGYIKNQTQTLKFELNVGVAFATFAVCQIPLCWVLDHYSWKYAAVWMSSALLLSAFAFRSSYDTSYVLASVRKWLEEGVLLKGTAEETAVN